MAQRLKEEVCDRICGAALEVFAEKGYRAATVAEIAETAGISSGNVYRYFEDKEALFRAVVSDELAATVAALVRRRVEAMAGVEDVRALARGAPHHLISEELLGFCIRNRLRVVVLLGKAQGTHHEAFGERMVEGLAALAIRHARSIDPGFEADVTARFVLDAIYRNFVRALVSILARFEDEPEIRRAVGAFSDYHLAGLKPLLAPARSSTRRR